MPSVMLGTYPDVFAGGAVVAGLPYHCATTLPDAFSCMNPGVDRTPRAWETSCAPRALHRHAPDGAGLARH